MKSSKKPTNTGYVTYRWLLTTIIASSASILTLVGAIANATFFTKAAGAAVEERVQSTDVQLTDMKAMITEMRQDVKILLVSQNKRTS